MCPDMCKGMCLYACRGQEKALGSWFGVTGICGMLCLLCVCWDLHSVPYDCVAVSSQLSHSVALVFCIFETVS